MQRSSPSMNEGRPVASGLTPQDFNSARSSSPTKASMTRTGLSSQIQSSRHSGKSVLCPRSMPSTKRFIRSPANRAGIITRESIRPTRFYTARASQQRSKPRPMFGAMDFGIADYRQGASREQAAQIAIASFADIAEPVLASTRVLLGDKANPGREAPP
jgi:hypothetical protein